MIITIGHTKGGVGKSTLAINIAIARALQGRDVLLIDGDRQGSALSSIALRSQSGQTPAIACAAYHDGPTLRAQVQQQAPKYDDVIIDAGGRDSSALRGALLVSDAVVVPFQPRTYDVWALEDIAKIITEAQEVREGLKAKAVLNCADTAANSTANRDAIEAIEGMPFDYIDAPICRRNSVSFAAAQGLSVHEFKPRDRKAIAEIEALVAKLF